MYITKLASNEIFSPPKKIFREVGLKIYQHPCNSVDLSRAVQKLQSVPTNQTFSSVKINLILLVIGLLTTICNSWLSGALPQRRTSDPPADWTIKVCTHSHRHSDKNKASRYLQQFNDACLKTRLLLSPTKTLCGVRSRKQIRFYPLGKTKGRSGTEPSPLMIHN
jgi:hypothetical protein